jgi:beta-N-acetylhexosaminidase
MGLVGCSGRYEQEYVAAATPSPTPTAAPTPTPSPSPELAPPTPYTYEYTPEEPCEIEYLLSQLTIEERIGQLFMLRLPWQTLHVNAAVENLFNAIPMGGVILFGDNVSSAEQVKALTAGLQGLSRVPLLISIDEEGGRVSRAGRLFSSGAAPAAYDIGRAQNAHAKAYETGRYIGYELYKLGVNMNFAPVADIWSNPANAVIGNRAFGRTADIVAPLVESTVKGLHTGGVMAVVKHFPGHGDTYEDSHFLLAVYHHDWERWLTTEALPFISGINAGADGVMIGHIATPAISCDLPATFSDFWLKEILRGEMGFDGLIITDALEMRALTDRFTCGQIATSAFMAGADILLMPSNPREAFDAMIQGYREGLVDEERLNQSVRRILLAKK